MNSYISIYKTVCIYLFVCKRFPCVWRHGCGRKMVTREGHFLPSTMWMLRIDHHSYGSSPEGFSAFWRNNLIYPQPFTWGSPHFWSLISGTQVKGTFSKVTENVLHLLGYFKSPCGKMLFIYFFPLNLKWYTLSMYQHSTRDVLFEYLNSLINLPADF